MLTLGNPWMLALAPLPLLIRALVPPFRAPREAVQIPFFELLASRMGATPKKGAAIVTSTGVQNALLATCWILLLLASARPQWLEEPITQDIPTRDLMLLIDLSGSMETTDFVNSSGEQVDRLEAVKEVLDGFLKERQGDRISMIVFGNGAFVQIPFTQDLDVCRELVDGLSPRMAGPKTALGDAIGLGITLFERSEIQQRVIIALTDGNDTGSKVPPVEAAKIAKDNDIQIHTIAIGDPEAAGEEKLDEEALKQVSETTSGRFFRANDREELQEVYSELDRLDTREIETTSYRPRRDLFSWPLAACLLLSMLSTIRFGTVKSKRSVQAEEAAT